MCEAVTLSHYKSEVILRDGVVCRESPYWLLLPLGPKFLARWWGPTNDILSVYECSLSS